MREKRLSGSEGGGACALPTPIIAGWKPMVRYRGLARKNHAVGESTSSLRASGASAALSERIANHPKTQGSAALHPGLNSRAPSALNFTRLATAGVCPLRLRGCESKARLCAKETPESSERCRLKQQQQQPALEAACFKICQASAATFALRDSYSSQG
jgi:hypothetical protein